MYPEREPLLDYEVVRQFALTFIHQRHCYPVQLPDGSYVTVKEPLRPRHIDRHLHGELTLGAYALDNESQANWIVLDADSPELHERLCAACAQLRTQGVPAYLEASRRGAHLWFFIEKQPGEIVRQFGRGIIQAFDLEGIELYPKQDTLKTGPGSLVRLPFGIHRLTGKRYSFVMPDGEPLAPTIRQQIALLGQPQRVATEIFAAFAEQGRLAEAQRRRLAPPRAFEHTPPLTTGTLSERIKAAISVRDFVSHYIDLNAQNRGYCPFHDDARMSFGVNETQNYWHCFAGCGGGSIIDFWSRWRQLHGHDPSFTATVTELASLLL